MKLYGSETSPYVRKVRICLIEKRLDCEFIVESPSDPDTNVVRKNPLGKVPLLERADGGLIFNSPMIVEYLDSLEGKALIPEGDRRWLAQRWHALGDGILDAVVARMLEGRRPVDKQDPGFLRKQEAKVAAALQFADEHFQDKHRQSDTTYLHGGQFSIADIAFGVALEYIDLRYPHDWRSSHLKLADWLDGINQRQSFTQTAPPKQ